MSLNYRASEDNKTGCLQASQFSSVGGQPEGWPPCIFVKGGCGWYGYFPAAGGGTVPNQYALGIVWQSVKAAHSGPIFHRHNDTAIARFIISGQIAWENLLLCAACVSNTDIQMGFEAVKCVSPLPAYTGRGLTVNGENRPRSIGRSVVGSSLPTVRRFRSTGTRSRFRRW